MRRATFVLALLLVAGCDGLDGVDTGRPATRVEVQVAADRWFRSRVESYRLRYELECFCEGGETTVTIRDGRVTAAEGPGAGRPETVDDLFARASEALEPGGTGEVRLSTGPLPIPIYVEADPVQDVADDEFRLTVTGFEAD